MSGGGRAGARVAVCVVNWNTRDELARCLEHVRAASTSTPAEVVVVDNASSDGSAGMVRERFPEAKLLSLDDNVGFAAANNLAIAASSAPYVLLLNPDVYLPADGLAGMAERLDRAPETAAVGGMLVGTDGRAQAEMYRRFPSLAQVLLFFTTIGLLARRVPALRRRWLEHDLRGDSPVEVEQLPGACCMVRRQAIDRVGTLDPDYFIWFEDVDWCWRMRAAGLRLEALPALHITHAGGSSFGGWSVDRRVWQFYRAFFRFLCKHRLEKLVRWSPRIVGADLRLVELAARVRRRVPGLRVDAWPAPESLRELRREIRRILDEHARGRLVAFGAADAAPGPGAREAAAVPADPEPTSVDALPDAAPSWRAPRAGGAAVDVVIVGWNDRRFLPECLRALGRSRVPLRVIVVDNASTDGSAAYVAAEHPDIELVALHRNVGYAGGANAGLRRCAGEYALVMNADVILAPDHVERLLARLESDPTVGAAQGKLYRTLPESFDADAVRPAGELDSAGHVIRRSRVVVDRGQGRPDGPEFDREASVFSACGAALFLRRAMLEDVAVEGEYFDESFFAYKEEIDLCWRARLLGWDVRYLPGAIGWHVRAWPHTGAPPRRLVGAAARRHSWKNHYLLLLKNDRLPDMLRSLPQILAWELVRQGYALLRDPAVYPAYAQLLRAVRGALRRRRAVMRRRRATPAAVASWLGAAPRAVAGLPAERETYAAL